MKTDTLQQRERPQKLRLWQAALIGSHRPLLVGSNVMPFRSPGMGCGKHEREYITRHFSMLHSLNWNSVPPSMDGGWSCLDMVNAFAAQICK